MGMKLIVDSPSAQFSVGNARASHMVLDLCAMWFELNDADVMVTKRIPNATLRAAEQQSPREESLLLAWFEEHRPIYIQELESVHPMYQDSARQRLIADMVTAREFIAVVSSTSFDVILSD